MAKTRSFTGDKIIGLLGLLIIVGVLSYVGIFRPLIIKQDKKRFLKAQASLEELYVQIIAKIGQPDEVKRDQSCDRANLKSEQGPLSCDVSINLILTAKNSSESTDIMKSTALILDTPLRDSLARTVSEFVSVQTYRGEQIFYQDSREIASLSCGVSYAYPRYPTYIDSTFRPVSEENLEIGLSCGGSAKAEHFPLKN